MAGEWRMGRLMGRLMVAPTALRRAPVRNREVEGDGSDTEVEEGGIAHAVQSQS